VNKKASALFQADAAEVLRVYFFWLILLPQRRPFPLLPLKEGRKNIKSLSNSRSLKEMIYNCKKLNFVNFKEKQRNIEYYKELQ
jgi:hypothetical protein